MPRPASGRFYPLVAPYLGLLAGFVSGSEASAIAMLTACTFDRGADRRGRVAVAAASGIGGGLASVISPAKLQNAAAAIDRIGEESGVLRVTFVISLAITAVAGHGAGRGVLSLASCPTPTPPPARGRGSIPKRVNGWLERHPFTLFGELADDGGRHLP